MEPVEPDSSGGAFSGLAVFLIIAGVLGLGVAGFVTFRVLGESAPTTTIAAAPVTTTTAPSTTTPTTVTTTLPPTATIAQVEEVPNPFVGWWKASDVDGSFIDLRVDAEGTFMYWDSASGTCEGRGFGHSPETWVGTAGFNLRGTPTLTVSGTKTCFPYGEEIGGIRESSANYLYDAATDMLEFVLDGVRYTRTPLPTVISDADPFVGSWEATDSDGTRVTMTIGPDGSWEQSDTRSGGCEDMGLTYATWSATGIGFFNRGGTPSFDVETTTFCHPLDGDPVARSEDVIFTFGYREATDEVVLLLFLETNFTRVP